MGSEAPSAPEQQSHVQGTENSDPSSLNPFVLGLKPGPKGNQERREAGEQTAAAEQRSRGVATKVAVGAPGV